MPLDWISLETIAILLSIGYLLLAIKESSLCWYCAFLSAMIFVYIFANVSLFMESLLNAFYMIMAVYGLFQWRRGGDKREGLAIRSWAFSTHLIIIICIFLVAGLSGHWLSSYTEAQFPYLDSLTTWASVVTTFMVARKILENWLYWLVIDSFSIYMFVDRELYQTAAMFGLYLFLALIGYFKWRKTYRRQGRTHSETHAASLARLEQEN